MKIRRADKGDIAALAALDREIFAVPWSLGAFVSEFSYPGAVYFAAEEAGHIVGYAGMRRVLDEGHITNVAVAEGFRRRGIARELMESLFSAGPRSFTLEVRRGNLAAISLYESLGFRTEGLRKAYYTDNREDALIMWKRNI